MCSVFSSKLTYVFKCVLEGKIQWNGHTSVHYYYIYTLHWKISLKIDFVHFLPLFLYHEYIKVDTSSVIFCIFENVMYCIVLQLNYWYRETRKRDKIDFSQTAKWQTGFLYSARLIHVWLYPLTYTFVREAKGGTPPISKCICKDLNNRPGYMAQSMQI